MFCRTNTVPRLLKRPTQLTVCPACVISPSILLINSLYRQYNDGTPLVSRHDMAIIVGDALTKRHVHHNYMQETS